jgi:Rps23 Pro-64 3,4-dihydroxylase Tpa1-like proline 4-hydroxylase
MFDYKKFDIKTSGNYQDRHPFPYAYFDGLFNAEILKKVNKEIDEPNFELDRRDDDGIQIKVRSDYADNESLSPNIKEVFQVINGGKFMKQLSRLTGIEGLISDPYFDGGGVNIIENKGTLAVHIDGTTQERMQVCRRVNVILFLNESWDADWNGMHEQWDFTRKDLSPTDPAQDWVCVRKILPKFNRLYVFTTNDNSWHGHAGSLKLPNGIERRSLIAYYYTSTRPESDLSFDSPHRAIFINYANTVTESAYEKTEFIF